MSISAIQTEAEKHMKQGIVSLQANLQKLRTGRAHPNLIENVRVNYYGTDTPLSQVATVTASDARTLVISPWEKNLVPEIEKAILGSDLGLNPVSTGQIVRVPLPALTEERRKDLTKVVKSEGEDARISIRNHRRDANQQVKDLLKKKVITEDEEHRAEEQIQKLTDKFIAEVDKLVAAKETELMEV